MSPPCERRPRGWAGGASLGSNALRNAACCRSLSFTPPASHRWAPPDSVAIDPDGNSYVAGSYSSSANFGAGLDLTGGKGYVAKIGSNGQGIWAKNLDGLVDLRATVDSSGNVYVLGYTQGNKASVLNPVGANGGSPVILNNQGDVMIEVLKFDPNGNYVPSFTQLVANGSIGATGFSPVGAVEAGSIAVDSQGNVLISGAASLGQSLVISSAPDFGSPRAIFSSPASATFVIKLNPSGGETGIAAVPDGNLDPNDGSSTSRIAVDPTGNVYLVDAVKQSAMIGGMSFNPPAGQSDTYVLKVGGGSGAIDWVARVGEGANLTVGDIAVDGTGSTYVAGTFQGSTSFGPTSTPTSLTTTGASTDAFLAGFDPSGNFKWANGYGGIGADSAVDVASDGHSEVFFAGTFQNTITLGGTSLTSPGSSDLFLAQVDSNGNLNNVQQSGGSSGYGYSALEHRRECRQPRKTGAWRVLYAKLGRDTDVQWQ